jgi:hypothetical protein
MPFEQTTLPVSQISAEFHEDICLPRILESIDQGDQNQILETDFARAERPFRRSAGNRTVGLHKSQEVLGNNVSQASTSDRSWRHDFERASPFFTVSRPLYFLIKSETLEV